MGKRQMKRRDVLTTSLSAAALAAIPAKEAFATDLAAVTRTGGETTLTRAELKEFADSLTYALLSPGTPRYDSARKIWNGIWDNRRPALIAQCADTDDVISAVNFARTHDLLVAVRGGGHSISGMSVCDGGLVIDLSPMRTVLTDVATKTVRVAGGALLGDVDRDTQNYGLVVPAGVVSHTGVAGLTLGGGIGRLMRMHGLTIDSLLAVDIVTADGQLRRASEDENQDLFWGVRGGGGNFGVVTAFEFKATTFGPTYIGGGILYSREHAKDALDFSFEFSENAPDSLGINAGMTKTEDGIDAAIIAITYVGDESKAERVLQPLRNFGRELADVTRKANYVEEQSGRDAANSHGRLYYIKGRHMNDYDPKMLDVLFERWGSAPGRYTTMRIVRFGGAVSQVDNDATAWPHRHAKWDIELGGHWTNPDQSEEYVQWGRDYWDALEPYTSRELYLNELMDEEQDQVNESYGQNYKRLVELKNKYDPTNLFRLNANIEPTV
ncbi:MAG: FAD-binding oxidoreductase [Rhodospirillaceae bacterium]|nr:FAD-binding oxidoreductase [Rhodospirillaceae bacterium]